MERLGLMRCVAKEAAHRGIRVNTIHPGPIDNDFQAGIERDLSGVLRRGVARLFDKLIPLGRHATPREIARSVLHLASDQSSFTMGGTLRIDGGMSV